MSYFNIHVTDPHENTGFVEYNRAFVVWGEFDTDETIPNDALLELKLVNEKGEQLRHCYCDKKNKDIFVYHPDLLSYKEELDPNRKQLIEYGFPELVVDDINNPYDSLYDATKRCWYNDKGFKAFFVSASDKEHGAIADYGITYVDENGQAYSCLPMGNYVVDISFSFDGHTYNAKKNVVIGQRSNQLICRFNPDVHKQRMVVWSKENKYHVVGDLLPGYLNPYLGTWYYHMGLLPMYRANDMAMYINTHVRMFDYLIDETSTSYSTELGYLQTRNFIEDKDRMSVYHYDIGEAIVGKDKSYERKANIVEFLDNDFLSLSRIDIVNDEAKENLLDLDEHTISDVLYDFNDLKIEANKKIAITGVIRPMQFDPNDYVLKDDNTYDIKNTVSNIKYTFSVDGIEEIEIRDNNMERIDKISIGYSIFEFYNIFTIKEEWKGKQIKVKVEVLDTKGNTTKANTNFEINVY